MTGWIRRIRCRGVFEAPAALAGASLLAGLLEAGLDLSNASAVYLLAVAAIAIRWGTGPAIVTAITAPGVLTAGPSRLISTSARRRRNQTSKPSLATLRALNAP